MRNALRAIVILGVLWVLDAVVFVPLFATAQAVKPTNKGACCIPGNPPTCGQLTQDNCTKHGGLSWTANATCAHNPCLTASTTTSTTGAATTTTSSAAPTTTTSSAAPTTTTSSAAPTTTTSSAAPTTTTSSAAPTTTTSSAAPTTTTSSAAPTTTTTSTSSTTTTTCPTGLSLKYTTAAGTTACGGAGFSPPAGAPFSGEIDSNTACTTKLFDLGASCLYIGGGAASTVPPGATPAGASSYLDVGPGNTLVASMGTGKLDCTLGSSSSAKSCVNAGTCVGGTSAGTTCIVDTDCAGFGTCSGPNPLKSCTI